MHNNTSENEKHLAHLLLAAVYVVIESGSNVKSIYQFISSSSQINISSYKMSTSMDFFRRIFHFLLNYPIMCHVWLSRIPPNLSGRMGR